MGNPSLERCWPCAFDMCTASKQICHKSWCSHIFYCQHSLKQLWHISRFPPESSHRAVSRTGSHGLNIEDCSPQQALTEWVQHAPIASFILACLLRDLNLITIAMIPLTVGQAIFECGMQRLCQCPRAFLLPFGKPYHWHNNVTWKHDMLYV